MPIAPLKSAHAMINIFIRNLDLNGTERQLQTLFEAYGAVESVTIVKDPDTGRSRGIAFIEMTQDEQARAAISSLDGVLLNERPLRVNEARPKLLDRLGIPPSGIRDHRRHRI
jgi:cold-inducible RNA-binding protein